VEAYVAVQWLTTEKITGNHPKLRWYNDNFSNERVKSAHELAKITWRGHPYTAQHYHHNIPYTEDGKQKYTTCKHTENFLCSNVFSLDFDGGGLECSTSYLYGLNPFISDYAAYLYPTQRSCEGLHEKGPWRTRVVFVCDELITDSTRYGNLVRALTRMFPTADQSCSDKMKIFAGNKGRTPMFTDKILPIKVLQPIADRMLEQEAALRDRRQIELVRRLKEANESLERVKSALYAINPDKGSLDYESWYKAVAAVYNAFPGLAGMALIEQWTGERNLHDLPAMFRTFDRHGGRRIGLGTLFQMAKERGWQDHEMQFTDVSERINYYALRGVQAI
jgi:hypothetical protein